ncbi:MAG TPA: protein kinase [Pyrinomonadaceae bacterium]|nr:protein kinase [Pyrinomonadaceae bacterium]
MTPERWQHIKTVFYGALACPPGERISFIDSACAGDEAVRREVSELISAHEEIGEFLDAPAFELAARSLAGSKPEALAPGQIINHYRIISSLGAGGMGEVYLAEDTRLRRRVALKLLSASFTGETDRVLRFAQEARAASALTHPNVCTIHEVGEGEDGRHYIVMEYVEGVTLRRHMMAKRMDVTEVLEVAIQIASGLTAAHTLGVVHRDVKPENVMLRPDGIVKVLDFGLAKLTEKQPAADSAMSTQPRVQTETGMVMGTVSYMSPEQARGLAVDARTDIWSLGVVLYEMLAGRTPFAGATNSDVIVSVLEREPLPLSRDAEVTAGLERIVTKALRKRKENRYQTLGDLAVDLKNSKEELEVEARLKRGLLPNTSGKHFGVRNYELEAVGAAGEPPARTGHVTLARPTASVEYLIGKIKYHRTFAGIALLMLVASAIALGYFAIIRNKAGSGARGSQSLAVLPLKPINVANRDEIYEIGIADALINRLGSTKGLVVRPLNATRRYADVGQDPLAAGKEQQVDYVLVSNYQLAAGKIRITAQLLDVISGQIEETYKSEKDASDVFAMQDAIASEIGNLLQARFATPSSTQAAKRGTSNEEAYLHYLQGMYLLDKESTADAKRAIELFDKALSIDSDYAKAWAGKARAHCSFAHWGGSSPDAEFAKAKPAIGQALALDNNLPEAYGVLGIIKADYDWNFAESERQFLRAIEIAPDSDNVYRWYAMRLAGKGRSEEAISRIKTAIDLNPNSLFHQIVYARILYFARRYDDAITQLQRVIEMDSSRPVAYSLLWRSYHQKGDYSRAYESFMRFQQLIQTKDEGLKNYETSYAKSGWQGVLLRNIEILKANNAKGSYAYNISVLSALLGQREQSLRYLNDAVKNRSLDIASINGDPGLDSLRDDPRFAELVRRVEIEVKPAA